MELGDTSFELKGLLTLVFCPKTMHLHCKGHRFDPWPGILLSLDKASDET